MRKLSPSIQYWLRCKPCSCPPNSTLPHCLKEPYGRSQESVQHPIINLDFVRQQTLFHRADVTIINNDTDTSFYTGKLLYKIYVPLPKLESFVSTFYWPEDSCLVNTLTHKSSEDPKHRINDSTIFPGFTAKSNRETYCSEFEIASTHPFIEGDLNKICESNTGSPLGSARPQETSQVREIHGNLIFVCFAVVMIPFSDEPSNNLNFCRVYMEEGCIAARRNYQKIL